MRIPGFVSAMALAACFHAGPAAALTPEQATQVGGDLTVAGKKLPALSAKAKLC
jgi:hypothetical protein